MALNPKMQVVVTVEELESIKEAANARADELEWQLRLELARVREVERNLARLLGEASTTVVPERAPRSMPAATTPPPAAAKVAVAVGSVAKPMPTPLPPRHTPSIESIALALAPPKPAAPAPEPAPTPVAAAAGATTRRPGQPPPLPPALRRAS